MYTTDSITSRITPAEETERLPPPAYKYNPSDTRVMLAVKAMKDHMTDEGWQIAQALEVGKYNLCGHDLKGSSDVVRVLQEYNPSTIVVQDKREWEGLTADRSKDRNWKFHNIEVLRQSSTFNVTILKDAHQKPQYHKDAAEEMNCHAWIIYYHPRIVSHLAPYVRREHLIRTYHTIDNQLVPTFSSRNQGTVISGAISNHYPLRKAIIGEILLHNKHFTNKIKIDIIKHPGYHRAGCSTSKFLQLLSKYRVSICTCSVYGYALRKIIESVACGCTVITDLPEDDKLPWIDDCLIRVDPRDLSMSNLWGMVHYENDHYDSDEANHFASLAKKHYDYRSVGLDLATSIERVRDNYA